VFESGLAMKQDSKGCAKVTKRGFKDRESDFKRRWSRVESRLKVSESRRAGVDKK
jgi:hypothetical protein